MRLLAALCLGAPLSAQAPTPPKVTGYIQPRFEAIGDAALFKLRRVRLGVQGGLNAWASYKAQVEVRSGGTGATAATVAATDLYLLLARGRWSATIGQSKTPFSIEFLRSSTVLELPERAMAVDTVAPNRDVGVKAEWNAAGPLALQAGVFNGDGINRAANGNSRFLYLGRAVVQPAAGAGGEGRGGLALGVSVAAKPDTTSWDVEAVVARPRLAARAEYLQRHRSGVDITTVGWYALAAYEVRPKRLQLVGRVQQFDPNDAVQGDRLTGYTGAAQYFFMGDDLKLQVEFTAFDEQGVSVDNNRVILQMQARF